MKNFKFKLIVLLFFLLAVGKVCAQNSMPQTVMISVQSEIKGSELHYSLFVIAPDDQYEVAMETRTVKTRKQSDMLNLKIIYNEINKWKQKGYRIDSTVADPLGLSLIIMSKD